MSTALAALVVFSAVAGAPEGATRVGLASRSELAGLPVAARELAPQRQDAEPDEPGSARVVVRRDPAPQDAPPRAPARRTPERVERAPAAQVPVEIPEVEEPPSRSKVAPLIVLGGSIAAGIVGSMYMGRALEAIDAMPSTSNIRSFTAADLEELKSQERAAITNGLIATVALSGAVAGLVTSTLLLIAD